MGKPEVLLNEQSKQYCLKIIWYRIYCYGRNTFCIQNLIDLCYIIQYQRGMGMSSIRHRQGQRINQNCTDINIAKEHISIFRMAICISFHVQDKRKIAAAPKKNLFLNHSKIDKVSTSDGGRVRLSILSQLEKIDKESRCRSVYHKTINCDSISRPWQSVLSMGFKAQAEY